MRAEYERFMLRLWEAPLVVPGTAKRGPGVVSHSDWRRYFSRVVYDPIEKFPQAARFLHELYNNDGSAFEDFRASQLQLTFGTTEWSPSQSCLRDGPYSPACQTVEKWQEEIQSAMYCTDFEGADGMSEEEFISFWDRLNRRSLVLGDIFAEYLLMCVGWSAKAAWRQLGTHPNAWWQTHSLLVVGPFIGKTNHPILLINNRLDPVTPLAEYVRP